MCPLPPEPQPRTGGSMRLPFAGAERGRAAPQDVPSYFIEVRVPGYDVAKTVAHARKHRQERMQRVDSGAGEREPAAAPEPPAAQTAHGIAGEDLTDKAAAPVE